MIDGGLSQLIQRYLPHFDWQRIESSAIASGVPDLNGCYNGVEVWLELKQTGAWALDIRPAQIGWAEKRVRHGGRVFMAVRRHCFAGPRKPAVDELHLFGGHQVRDLSAWGLKSDAPRLGIWIGRPANWNWKEIETILLKCKCCLESADSVA